jgi:hypothetical protein
MAKFQFTPLTEYSTVHTARLGAGTGSGNWLTDAETNKLVKLAGDSRYDLCAVGNEIEGFIAALENATLDNYTIGSVQIDGRLDVTFDGLQATPGTGTVAIGDFVVAGTPAAKGTALVWPAGPKVCKATAAAAGLVHLWRVVSLGSAGTGAVGTAGLIERLA